jgi:hypothetical protein
MQLIPWIRGSVVSRAIDYRLDDRGVGLRVQVGSRILFSPRRPDRPFIQWVPVFPGVKWPGLEAEQRVPRSRKCGSIHPLPHTPSWRSAELVKHRDNFYFNLDYTQLQCIVSSIAESLSPDCSKFTIPRLERDTEAGKGNHVT